MPAAQLFRCDYGSRMELIEDRDIDALVRQAFAGTVSDEEMARSLKRVHATMAELWRAEAALAPADARRAPALA